MVEAAEEYKARLAVYAKGKDPVAMQRQAPRTLAQLIEGVAETTLSLKPAPGKWSVTEILAHMAEDELRSTWRYRQILEHDAPELLGFDQEMWARLGDYTSWKPQEALEMFLLQFRDPLEGDVLETSIARVGSHRSDSFRWCLLLSCPLGSRVSHGPRPSL